MSNLANRARAFAQGQPRGSGVRNILNELADTVDGAPPTSSGSLTFDAVRNFLRSRKVNLMGWQWKRAQGPVTMKQEGEEWVEL